MNHQEIICPLGHSNSKSCPIEQLLFYLIPNLLLTKCFAQHVVHGNHRDSNFGSFQQNLQI